MPILMLAIIFGLSMDYEVFLVSRIRERANWWAPRPLPAVRQVRDQG